MARVGYEGDHGDIPASGDDLETYVTVCVVCESPDVTIVCRCEGSLGWVSHVEVEVGVCVSGHESNSGLFGYCSGDPLYVAYCVGKSVMVDPLLSLGSRASET